MVDEEMEVEYTEIVESEVSPAEEAGSKKLFGADKAELQRKAIYAAILLVLALISIFLIAGVASNPETYSGINNTLDEKKNNVLGLVATTTAASAAISIIPNVGSSGLSAKIADFSTYFLIILAVIYLEKFLLTTIGSIVFAVLVPASCALFIVSIFLRSGSKVRRNIQNIGTKVLAFGLALFLVVPVSVWVSDNIDNSYEASLLASNTATQEAVNQLNEEINAEEQQQEEEQQGFFEGIANTVQNGFNAITQGAKEALSNLTQQLNNLIDTFAVMIVTSCLIPLIVLALFLKLASIASGIDFGGAGNVMSSVNSKREEMFSSIKKKSKGVKAS